MITGADAPPGAVAIPLQNGKFTWVDEADAADVRMHPWRLDGNDSVSRRVGPRGSSTVIYLHRQLLCLPAGTASRHINGVRTDNRRCNLAVGRGPQPSPKGRPQKLRGVSWHKRAKKWTALVQHRGQRYYLGSFDSPEAAHAACTEKKAELQALRKPT